MKRIILIGLIVTAFCPWLYAQSLDECLSIARANNAGLKARLSEFEAAVEKVPQVGALPDPTFSVSAFGQMVETRVGQQMARFSLSQIFPWFGTLTEQKNAAALMAQAKYQSYRDAASELEMNVKSTYYALVELDQLIRLQEENLKILAVYKSLATARFQNGKAKMTDALQVDIMANTLSTEIFLLKEKEKPLRATLNALLNRPLETAVTIEPPADEVSPEALSIDSMLLNNPRLQEMTIRAGASRAMARAGSKQGMPKVGIGFEYIVTAKRPDMDFPDNGKDAYMPMLTVSLPIYRKKYTATINEAKYAEASFLAMHDELENKLSAEFERALFDHRSATERTRLYQMQTEQTKQIIDLLLKSYENDASGFDEVLRLQQMLLQYQMQEVSESKNLRLAEARLTYLVAQDPK
jgi:outer membrane protein TolC